MANFGTIVANQPFERFVAVTPADATTFMPPIEALYIGVTGDLVVTDIAGNVVTLTGVLAGTIYPVRCTKVMAATTATSIVACFR